MAVFADMKPMCCRTCAAWLTTSYPARVAVPPVGRSTVQRMRMVVVLPAPLGPSSPKISPGLASKLTPSTAWTRPRRRSRNDFLRFSTTIMSVVRGRKLSKPLTPNPSPQRGEGRLSDNGQWNRDKGGRRRERVRVDVLVEDVAL